MRLAKSAHILALAGLLGTAAPALAARPVVIERDTWGIAHVHGTTDADAVYGMIRAQAEDDFNRIETNYLTALGRLAEAEGESAIWDDLRQRLFFPHARLRADYARAPLWLKKLCIAWAGALNDHLAAHPEVHPRVLRHFEPWMALSFSEGSIRGDVVRVPLEPLAAFYGGGHNMLAAVPRAPVPELAQGSNGFAIGPSHSANGHALLLINPHTSFFFRAEQQVTSDAGLNAYGAATWGQFFIYQGFNERAGWMHTTSQVQRVDRFAETVAAGRTGARYRFGHRWLPVRRGRVTLAFRKADGSIGHRSFATLATHHGPITGAEGGKWIASALMVRPLAALEQSFLRTKVHDLAGFTKVAQLRANSSNNTLFADSKGEIAYFHPQYVPLRNPRADYRLPVDGSNPANDQRGPHPLASLPQVINPKNGWVFNVNDAPWRAAGADSPRAADFPAYMNVTPYRPRTAHAERVLSQTPRFTLDSLTAAAFDSWLSEFDRQLPLLFAADAAVPDPARAGPIALLRGWDHRFAKDSTATSLAVFWAETLAAEGAASADRELIPVQEWMVRQASPAQRLSALDKAVARLTNEFGSWQVKWSDINCYQRNDGAISQIFDDSRPSIPVPFASADWGSLADFEAKAWPGTKRWYGTQGNSFVAVVEFGPKVVARAVSTGGESGDPASPHFADQAQRYADGNLRPVYFYPEDLAGHVTAREVFKRK